MFRKYEITCILIIISAYSSTCSKVVDLVSQKGVHIWEYCPQSKHCGEGSHVLCMYYDEKSKWGPVCVNPVEDVVITDELARRILEITNAIRSRIARGVEQFKNGEQMPRAYSMFKVSWDEELATFAQVLANHCVLQHDLCRATEKFSNPGQSIGLFRLSYPNWIPVTRNKHNLTVPGLTIEKIKFAMTKVLETWYIQKNHITVDAIKNYPDWTNTKLNVNGRLYLAMVHGATTHVGCGVSAFKEYTYHANNAGPMFNVVMIVCNFSTQPTKGTEVYSMTKIQQYSKQCGCPPGYKEDYDCLCYESDETENSSSKSNEGVCDDIHCEPSIVLLPIVTVEDAPPEKLVHLNSYRNNTENLRNSKYLLDTNKQNTKAPISDFNDLLKETEKWKQLRGMNHRHSKRRHHGTRSEFTPNNIEKEKNPPQQNMLLQSQYSINTKLDINEPKINIYKENVTPRKDYLNAQNLITTQLKKNSDNVELQSNDIYKYKFDKSLLFRATTDLIPYDPNINVLHPNQNYDYDINLIQMSKTKSGNDYTDTKIFNLLNDLEEEIARVQLGQNEKEILDEKIKRIYNSIVSRKERESKTYKNLVNRTENQNFNKYEEEANNLVDKLILETEGRKETKPRISDIEIKYNRLIKRVHDDLNAKRIKYKDMSSENSNKEIKNKNIYGDEKFKKYEIRDKNELEDLLNIERRKYYQEKLDILQGKLKSAHNHRRGMIANRRLRPVRPDKDTKRMSRPEHQMINFYMPDRARFLHGF